jgi:hypothetical protein
VDHSVWEVGAMVDLPEELLGRGLSSACPRISRVLSSPTNPDQRFESAIRWVLRTAFGLPPVLPSVSEISGRQTQK